MATRIELSPSRAGLRVAYHRVDPGRILVGTTPDDALRIVPSLLPVCGEAQRIAAARALESAQGITAKAVVERERERLLLREQGRACAWRLLVDWPRAAGRHASLVTMKTLRKADDVSLGRGLLALLPHSLAIADSGASQLARLIEEATSGASCISSTLLRVALEQESGGAAPSVATLTPPSLFAHAREFFAAGHCDPATLALANTPAPITVGPLAMARHPAISAIGEHEEFTAPVRLLLAAILDSAAIASALASGSSLPSVARAMGNAAAPGFGHSFTARGPLLHRITLDDDGRIALWRHLAPTDWHFAPGGLVERLGEDASSRGTVDLLLAAADPCAPCSMLGEDDPLPEAA